MQIRIVQRQFHYDPWRQSTSNEIERTPRRIGKIDPLGRQFALFAEGQQLTGQTRSLVAGVENSSEIRSSWMIFAQTAQGHLAKTENDSQQIIEIMGNAAGQATYEVESLSTLQVVLQLPLQGHIDDQASHARGIPA